MTFDSVVQTFRRICRKGLLTAAMLAAVGSLSAGCSSVPDAVNPVEWYKGTRDWVTGEDEKKPAKQEAAKPIPDADKPFPSLNTVPDRPPETTAAERKQMASSLTADREAAHYSDERIRRQTSAVASAQQPSGASGTSQQSSQVAQTAQPVPPPLSPPTSSPPTARRGPAVTNQTASAEPTQQRMAEAQPEAPIPEAPMTPPPPPSISQVIEQAQPVAVTPTPTPTQGYAQSRSPVQNPGTSRVTRSRQRMAYVNANRFSPRFPAGATSAGGPRYVPPPAPTYGVTLPPQLDVSPSAGFSPGAVIPSGAGLTQDPSPQPGAEPVATIHFGVGSARVGASGRRQIRRAYRAWRSRGGRIYVVGHASSRTRNLNRARHELVNFRVSYDRARAVARELVRLGVDPGQIVVSAVSDHDPAYVEVMPAGEAGNRRAEIILAN